METKKISDLLRNKIVWLELKPEIVININEMADFYRVSRTPVKEALILLQGEGWLLRNGPHFMVTPLSLNRIKEITEIRLVMEIQAYIWAMRRITTAELTALREIKQQISELDEISSNKQVVELDLKFHRILYRATKNSQLAQLLERLLCQYLRFWLSIPLEMNPEVAFRDTVNFIRAIEAKDEAILTQVAAEHIKISVDKIMGTF
jgi:DNA-binding GntR family transcriptional regulator